MNSGALFLIGGGGIVLFALIGIVSFVVLRRKRKKLEEQIHSEYDDSPRL